MYSIEELQESIIKNKRKKVDPETEEKHEVEESKTGDIAKELEKEAKEAAENKLFFVFDTHCKVVLYIKNREYYL